MPEPLRRLYWDSCVFLAYVNNEVGRADIIDTLLFEARNSAGLIEIITSAVTITEVAGGVRIQSKVVLTQEIEDRISRLWSERAVIKVVEFHELVAIDARELIRKAHALGLTSLRSMDAIHLATAKRLRATEFNTYDDLSKFSELASLHIREPFTVQRPLFHTP
jgi:predicted nucleic acid-binding protein